MIERDWMYTGWSCTQAPSNDWIENTNQFLDRAFSMPNVVEDGTIKCPCAKCRNCVRQTRFTVEMHLCSVGFKDNYRIWTAHGEGVDSTYVEGGHDEAFCETDHMDALVEKRPLIPPRNLALVPVFLAPGSRETFSPGL